MTYRSGSCISVELTWENEDVIQQAQQNKHDSRISFTNQLYVLSSVHSQVIH